MLSPRFDINSRMIFSGEGEDVILHNLFLNYSQPGFYVDVGAHHPKRYSNTYLFYKRGWRGINIDAAPGSMRAFKRIRPRDINLEIGCAKIAGRREFHIYDEPLVSTFSNDLVRDRAIAENKWRVKDKVSINVLPLREILDMYLPKEQGIDFMTIDVEGLDLEVLESNDWSRYRPKYILCEVLEAGNGPHDTGDVLSISECLASNISKFMEKNEYIPYFRSGNTVFYRNERRN